MRSAGSGPGAVLIVRPCAFKAATRSPVDGKAEADTVSKGKAWKQVKADWRDVVLVCRKCSKKLDGGFGPDGDEALSKALRRTLGARGRYGKVKPRRREVAVLDVGCLDICPKKAVVALRAAAPERWLVVPEGADLADVVIRLGLSRPFAGGSTTMRSVD